MLHRHLVNKTTPLHFLSEQYDVKNSAYLAWDQQDSLLFMWLLSTLSESVLARILRCAQSHRGMKYTSSITRKRMQSSVNSELS